MVGVVALAHNVFRRGQDYFAVLVGIACGLHLIVEGELHLVHVLRSLGGELRNGVRAEHLSPHGFASAVLQQMRHLAASELLLGYRRALRIAAGVEVVAVVDFGVVPGKGVVFVVVGVVRAEVEAVGQGTVAILTTYKSANFSSLFRDSEVALDDAVGNGKLGITDCQTNHAR